jgi:hypothetical protein
MSRASLLLVGVLVLVISCGPKAQKTKKGPPPPTKQEQIEKARKAFEELEREAEKPAKDLTLEEGTSLRKPPEKELKKYPVELAKREAPKTKYPMRNGFPIWVSDPNYGGVLGGVGIAKKIPGKGYAEQRRLAKHIAIADLAKQIEIIVKTELDKIEINVDTSKLKYYKKKFSAYSEQEVRSMLIKNAVIEDEWVDPKTGELYIWVVIK